MSHDKFYDFKFYASRLLSWTSGAKTGSLILAETNLILGGLILQQGEVRAASPFLLYAAGLATRRVAYNAYGWAREKRRDCFHRGWERLDRQICLVGDGLVGLASVDLACQFEKLNYEDWQNTRGVFAPASLIVAGIAFGFNGCKNFYRAYRLTKDQIGGFRNLLSYRSKYALNAPANR